jgi:hypothetical protein
MPGPQPRRRLAQKEVIPSKEGIRKGNVLSGQHGSGTTWRSCSMAQEETIIDPRLARLVAALNAIPGVRTYASCGGHAVPGAGQVARDKFYVSFDLTRNRQG